MIVLDTNVISALMQSTPDEAVVAWLDSQPPESVWTTSVCVFEILFGLETMTTGKKQHALRAAFQQTLEQDIEGRILDFCLASARESASLSAKLRKQGRAVEIRDMQIAGIVTARRGSLATRNTRHFVDTGIALIDPWECH